MFRARVCRLLLALTTGIGYGCPTKLRVTAKVKGCRTDRLYWQRRREGTGRALMTGIENRAQERGCSYIFLLTDADRPGNSMIFDLIRVAIWLRI